METARKRKSAHCAMQDVVAGQSNKAVETERGGEGEEAMGVSQRWAGQDGTVKAY